MQLQLASVALCPLHEAATIPCVFVLEHMLLLLMIWLLVQLVTKLVLSSGPRSVVVCV